MCLEERLSILAKDQGEAAVKGVTARIRGVYSRAEMDSTITVWIQLGLYRHL